MISELEKKLIDKAQYEEDVQACIEIVKKSTNPFFLKEYAIIYNWDDGFDIPNAIADNEFCDLGTALTLFWLAEGMCFYDGEIERDEYNGDWADFCEKLIKRLSEGAYIVGPVSFNPGLGKVAIYKLEKSKVPPVFYQEVVGASNESR